MTKIEMNTIIEAPISKVFDAARNIDLHQNSAIKSKEKAIDGIISGCINLHETVTWRGKHFGIYLKHQSKITDLVFPTYFVDKMINGHFKSFRHQHIFTETSSGTDMKDILGYETPFGFFGKLFDILALKKHLTNLLKIRNDYLKVFIEKSKSY